MSGQKENKILPYLDNNLDIESRVLDLLSRLTLKEKFELLSSPGKRRIYSTKAIKRLGIPSFKMTDGPLGLSYQSSGLKKATRFPATISLAASWNKGLAKEMGIVIGKEVRSLNRHMVLAPGINIDRTPLNGRTFEYFSEDPYLTKELAVQYVKGVQSEGIGTCLKHYAANNQETNRRSCSSEVDERTLHELYLRAFRAVVKEADPWAVMACYNKVNGVYGCENEYLIREVLMEKWGFKGFVMSDWFATRPIETAEGCINGGLSLEMPWPNKYKFKLLDKAYAEGKFSDDVLSDLVGRYLRAMFLTSVFSQDSDMGKGARNTPEHQNLARRMAEEGTVLLKNERSILPIDLDSIDRISVLGPNLKKKFGRFLYGGSSAVVPPYEVTPLQGIKKRCKDKIQIVKDPSQADIAIVFAGLDHGRGKDSESSDRTTLELPKEQIELINQTAELNPNTIVVLIAGSPIAMNNWMDNVPAILLPWYAGMEGGNAIANILFGNTSPSGKLPLTFPKQLSDSPAHSSNSTRTFPGDEEKKVHYDEGIFVGYRWFEKQDIEPLFPFGFGLSFAEFKIDNIHLNKESLVGKDDVLTIELDVANISNQPGSEIIQIYSSDSDCSVQRPMKELVSFEKVQLNHGDTRNIQLEVKAEDLAFYDVSQHDWTIEPGTFEILIAKSSQDIVAKSSIHFN